MKKNILIFILTILLVNIVVADVSATTVFLTSDNIANTETDSDRLNSISDFIKEISNGKISVIIDSQAPQPGESSRAMESSADVKVIIGACCAGSFYIMAKYSSNSDSQMIYVNSGDYDLDEENYLRRAWDDNYSNGTFAGINNPGKFLKESGISYIQPIQKYPDAGPDGYLESNDDKVNRYIAEEIVKAIEKSNTTKDFDSSLIARHDLPVSEMAKGSSELYSSGQVNNNETYNGFTAPQLLYLTSSYLNGNGLEDPDSYKNPSSPLKYSLFTKDSYSIYEYMEMGGIVKNYMDDHGEAPDYINYKGAYINYEDLEYNFAKITENHTDFRNMDFEREYNFDKVNDSILISMLPFLLIAIVLLGIYLLIRKVKKRKG